MAIFDLLSMSHGQSTALIALTIFALIFFVRKRAERLANPQGLPYPPGPKPLPIIGNILDIARENEAQVYQQLAREHGASHVLTFAVYLFR
jgi:isoprenylcysteine carboxyl methyltransferase (ICMT) family protein YpbQ